MILQKSDNTLEKSSEFKNKTFGIKDAGKVFRILIDGIYSDGPGSIMREIASNCIDANKESGSTKNIEITFVEKDALLGEDYSIIFKDYGVGISPERMYDIFCYLGESTKDGDNEAIGGYGLGSKSPFKYTDTITVKTVNSGREYYYCIVLNEQDIPEVNEIFNSETDKESGTEIIIPIKNYYDFGKFKEAAQKQLCYFDNITYNNFTIDKPNIVYNGDRIMILEKPSYDYSSNQKIIIGNIPYNFNCGSSNNTKKISNYVVIKFKIGEIQPTASREDINYKASTYTMYQQVYEEANKELLKYVDSLLLNEDNLFKYLSLCNSFNITVGQINNVDINKLLNIQIAYYNKRSWRTNVSTSYEKLSRIVSDSLTIYYSDKSMNISELSIKNYVRDTNSSIYIIPLTYSSSEVDYLKKYCLPLTDIISPIVKGPRNKVNKQIIKYTDIYLTTVRELDTETFKKSFLKDTSRPLVYAFEKSDYLSDIWDRYIKHIRLDTANLNKLEISDNIIFVKNKKELIDYLLKNNKQFVRDLICNFYPKIVRSDNYTGDSNYIAFKKYLRKYNNTMYNKIEYLVKSYYPNIQSHPLVYPKIKTLRMVNSKLLNIVLEEKYKNKPTVNLRFVTNLKIKQ